MNQELLRRRLLSFIREDAPSGDLASTFIPSRVVKAEVLLKEAGVLSGVEEVKVLFGMFNVEVLSSLNDGVVVPNPKRILLLKGDARDIILTKRTAINILSRMSGITTLTQQFIQKAKKENPKIKITATRKTTPGFRYFEKKAVQLAGGDTHRMGLSDMVMIKDNHLKVLGGVAKALKEAKKHTSFTHKIEVEVRNKKDALSAVENGADIVLLDNMSPGGIADVLSTLQKKGLRKKSLIEASGGITLENISEYAKTGVDVISIGRITTNYRALDMSVEFR